MKYVAKIEMDDGQVFEGCLVQHEDKIPITSLEQATNIFQNQKWTTDGTGRWISREYRRYFWIHEK